SFSRTCRSTARGTTFSSGRLGPESRGDVMLRSTKTKIGILVAALALGFAATAHANQNQLVNEANATKAALVRSDPGLASCFANAAGYAVFPGIGKAALGVGGAHGSGIVYEQGRPVGKATLSQVSVGLQAGGQEYSEIIFFETPAALAHFMQGKM